MVPITRPPIVPPEKEGLQSSKAGESRKMRGGMFVYQKNPPGVYPARRGGREIFRKIYWLLRRDLTSCCSSNYSEDSAYDDPRQTDDSKAYGSLFKDLESFLIFSFVTGSRHHIESASEQNNQSYQR